MSLSLRCSFLLFLIFLSGCFTCDTIERKSTAREIESFIVTKVDGAQNSSQVDLSQAENEGSSYGVSMETSYLLDPEDRRSSLTLRFRFQLSNHKPGETLFYQPVGSLYYFNDETYLPEGIDVIYKEYLASDGSDAPSFLPDRYSGFVSLQEGYVEVDLTFLNETESRRVEARYAFENFSYEERDPMCGD